MKLRGDFKTDQDYEKYLFRYYVGVVSTGLLSYHGCIYDDFGRDVINAAKKLVDISLHN